MASDTKKGAVKSERRAAETEPPAQARRERGARAPLLVGLASLAACAQLQQVPFVKVTGVGGSFGRSGSTSQGAKGGGAQSSPADGASSGTGRMAGLCFDCTTDASRMKDKLAEFAKQCFAGYETMQAQWGPREAKLRKRFEAMKTIRNYYDMVDELRSFAKDYHAEYVASKFTRRDQFTRGAEELLILAGGLRYEVDAFFRDVAVAQKNTSAWSMGRAMKEYSVVEYTPIEDDLLAGDVFCRVASAYGATAVNGFYPEIASTMFPDERAKAIRDYNRRKDELLAKLRERFDFPEPPQYFTSISLGDAFMRNMEIPIGSRLNYRGPVVANERSAAGALVKVRVEGQSGRQHDCVETNKVDGIRADGRVIYREECQRSTAKTQQDFLLTFKELPAALKVGDWINFTAIVRTVKRGPIDAGTGMPRTMVLELDGELISEIDRAKTKGGKLELVAEY